MLNIGSELVCIKANSNNDLVVGKHYRALDFECCKCGLSVDVGTKNTNPEYEDFTRCGDCGHEFKRMFWNINLFAELSTFQQTEVNELMKEVNEKQPFQL